MATGLRKRPKDVVDEDSASIADKGTSAKATTPGGSSKRSCLCKTLKYSTLAIVLLVSVLGALHYIYYEESQLVLMRFFRDLSRSKAHKRLHGNDHGLVTILRGQEELLPIKEIEDDGLRMSLEDLTKFNGEEGSPLYLAIMGRIYDVSAGKAFYGPGRSYHHYVAKDATRSFATGCTQAECLVPSLVGLSESQKREARKWLELYEYHDKYKFIGMVEENPVADLVEQAMLEDQALKAAQDAEAGVTASDGTTASFDVINEKALDLFKNERFDEALSFFKSALVILGEAKSGDLVEKVLSRADILINMASLAQKKGDFEQAQESYEEAMDSLSLTLGDDNAHKHPMYGRALSDKAAALVMNREFSSAIQGFKRAVSVYTNAVESGEEQILATGNGRETLRRTIMERANTKFNLVYTMLNTLTESEPITDEILSLAKELVEELEKNGDDPKLSMLREKSTRMLASILVDIESWENKTKESE